MRRRVMVRSASVPLTPSGNHYALAPSAVMPLLRAEGVSTLDARRSFGTVQGFVAQGLNLESDRYPVLIFLAAALALRLHPSADGQSERLWQSVLKYQLSCDIGSGHFLKPCARRSDQDSMAFKVLRPVRPGSGACCDRGQGVFCRLPDLASHGRVAPVEVVA